MALESHQFFIIARIVLNAEGVIVSFSQSIVLTIIEGSVMILGDSEEE